MKLRHKSWLLAGAALFSLMLLGVLVQPDETAAATDTVTTSIQLQSKILTALDNHSSSYEVIYSGTLSNSKNEIKKALTAAIIADDYIHYTVKTYGYSANGSKSSIKITFKFTYWETLSQSKYVKSQVTKILKQIVTSDMSDTEKEKVIHDWVVMNLAYDKTLVSHSAYDGLANGKTVCQGYALLTYEMFNQAGISVKIVEGRAGGQAHTWNLVQIDGKWYHLDTTWDDPTPDVAGRAVYNYFNLTDAQMKADHTWKLKSYPAATTSYDQTLTVLAKSDSSKADFYNSMYETLEYAYLSDTYTATNVQELAKMIQSAVQKGEEKLVIRYTNGASAAASLKKAMASQTGLSGYKYSLTSYTRTTIQDKLITLTFVYA